jgi:2,3,4,5-tetrahydropyridine-2-carboxylate N-succinyltransferase
VTFALGFGVATMSCDKVIDVRFLSVLTDTAAVADVVRDTLGVASTGHRAVTRSDLERVAVASEPIAADRGDVVAAVRHLAAAFPRPHKFIGHDYQPIVAVVDQPTDAPVSAADVYLRLHCLSLRLAPPRSMNLDGMFGLLNTNVWTTEGVVDQARFDEIQSERALTGEPLVVLLQDKFPRMLDYVSPSGVRVLNPNNVRLGAHLAAGTVVMTAGAVNFNAGTLGEAMVEGRISAGIVVGARSDVGGGASLMGTLSGGNQIAVSVGEDCLIEAMAGLGIPVGDRVRVEVGFYVKSTTPVFVVDSPEWASNAVAQPHVGATVKAIALAGISDAVFRRNARTGTPEVVPRGNHVWGQLNAALHQN